MKLLNKYDRYDVMQAIKNKRERIYALCSTQDELLGCSLIDVLQPILSSLPYVVASHFNLAGDFGHRCSGDDMEHLFSILDGLCCSRYGAVITTYKELEEWKRIIGLIP